MNKKLAKEYSEWMDLNELVTPCTADEARERFEARTETKASKKSRGWCFTVNNYIDDDCVDAANLYESYLDCKYLVIGYEVGKRCGTPHLQCYVYFNDPITWDTFYYRVGAAVHFEPQKAKKNVNCYTYCMKDRVYLEYGEAPQQGNRGDLEYIKHKILDGESMKDISMNYFSQFVQYNRGFDKFSELHRPKYETKTFMYHSHVHNKEGWVDMMQRYNPNMDLMVLSDKIEINQFLFDIYSKKYRYVFYPDYPIFTNAIRPDEII
nr:MAG: replication associated protein [Cressdnaviricota sp.]